MKKFISAILCFCVVLTFGFFAIASGEDTSTTDDQGTGTVDTQDTTAAENSNLGDYTVEILSCRLAKDFEDKDVVIVKYKFTNNGDEPSAFYTAFEDNVYQDGVGLNKAFVIGDSYDYSEDNQTKNIKTGSSLDVEVAYELNDTTTNIEVEVAELFSFDESKVTKTFSITE